MTSMFTQSLLVLADIRPRAIDDWPRYREEGEQLLQLAERAHGRHMKAFTTTILYNLVAMATEKLVMAALMRCGQLPDNHTLPSAGRTERPADPGKIRQRARPPGGRLCGRPQVWQLGKRAVVYGEEDLVVGLCSFLAEIGIRPVL